MKTDVNSYFGSHSAADFAKLPRLDFVSWWARDIPTTDPESAIRSARPILEMIADRGDELTEHLHLKALSRKLPDVPLPAFQREVARLRRKHTGAQDRERGFRPDEYADKILSQEKLLYHHEDFFGYHGGVYRPVHHLSLKKLIQELGQGKFRKNEIEDVFNSLTIKSFRPTKNVNQLGILNLRNGWVDLNSEDRSLRPHTPDLYSTIQIRADLDEAAACPQFSSFLREKLPDPDLRRLSQEMAGYLLTPSTRFQCGFILIGGTGTGKSTLLHVINQLLGPENCSHLALDKLSERFSAVMLDNRLANFSSEVAAKEFLEDNFIKAVVAGDTITGEKKYRDAYSFRPTSRLVIAANRLPLTKDQSPAFYRRWKLIPMNEQRDMDSWDWDLPEKICNEELSGILLWAVAGLDRLQRQNVFTKSAASQAALEQWARDADPVREWCHRALRPGEGSSVPLKKVFTDFHEWAERTNRKTRLTDNSLRNRLEEIGYVVKRRSSGWTVIDQWFTPVGLDEEGRSLRAL